MQVTEWQPYSHYGSSQGLPPVELHPNLYYLNGIEWAGSAMEMSSVAAKNIALLAYHRWNRQTDMVDQRDLMHRIKTELWPCCLKAKTDFIKDTHQSVCGARQRDGFWVIVALMVSQSTGLHGSTRFWGPLSDSKFQILVCLIWSGRALILLPWISGFCVYMSTIHLDLNGPERTWYQLIYTVEEIVSFEGRRRKRTVNFSHFTGDHHIDLMSYINTVQIFALKWKINQSDKDAKHPAALFLGENWRQAYCRKISHM